MSRTGQASERISTLAGGMILVTATALVAGAGLLAGTAEKPGGGAALAFAAGVCLAGALGGWTLARWPVSIPSRRVAQGLGSTAVRLFGPLVALGWLQAAAPGLRQAGAGEWLLIFYLVLLAVDIFLTIIGGPQHRKNTGEISEN
ncbi:MAG: hypothetical protein ACK6CT_00480 [Planctomycetia bacterium]|jgi:hypothetical protein